MRGRAKTKAEDTAMPTRKVLRCRLLLVRQDLLVLWALLFVVFLLLLLLLRVLVVRLVRIPIKSSYIFSLSISIVEV